MNDFYRIASLFRKFRARTIQEEEARELREWMNLKKGRNRELFIRVMNREREMSKIRELKKYDRELAFREFVRRTRLRKRKMVYYLRVAVAVILPIVFGGLIYWWVDSPGQKTEALEEVFPLLPGQKRAVLTLDDGTLVALGDAIENEIVLEVGDGLKIDSMGLRYGSKDTKQEMKMNELYVPKRGEYSLVLSDGTRVFLNSDSRLVYPVTFGDGTREVVLQGEAYFDVAEDEKHPFVVRAGELSVRVLGTAFNLSSYPDDDRVHATLVRGKVQVREGERVLLLKPGEQACLDRESGEMNKVAVNTFLYTSWKDGLFVFERERLENMLTVLSRWYDVVIFYQRPAVKDELFTGDLKKYDNIEEHLKMLEMTTDVQFEIQGNTIIVK